MQGFRRAGMVDHGGAGRDRHYR